MIEQPVYNKFEYPISSLTDEFFKPIDGIYVQCKLCNKIYKKRVKKCHLISRHHPSQLENYYNEKLLSK
jgi:hypothetical protein